MTTMSDHQALQELLEQIREQFKTDPPEGIEKVSFTLGFVTGWNEHRKRQQGIVRQSNAYTTENTW